MPRVLAPLLLVLCPPPQEPASASATPGPAREATLPAARLQACTDAAAQGLRWLADRQGRAGAWTGLVGHKMQNDYVEIDIGLPVERQRLEGRGHMGVTAICGMAFLAGGHLPDRGEHGQVVQRTIDYVLAHVQESGLLSDSGTRMYEHAFATLFLAEVYGMAGGKAVKETLEKAVNLIVDCQNQHGGWRYNPFDRETDLSVTVCQLQSLRAARNIGIKVPEETVRRAVDYVQASRVRRRTRGGGQFYYKIYGRGDYEKPDEYAINAAALTALASAGIYDRQITEPTLDFLDQGYGELADYRARHYFYWYGSYYACQAYFQAGGTRFTNYYLRLSGDLLGMQQGDGRWCCEVGPGDEFSTAVACLLLQLPRQYLPIFQR
jgi:hypothetical protein